MKKNVSVRSRSYSSWIMYMLLLATGRYFYSNVWYLFALMMALLSWIFFMSGNKTVLEIAKEKISFLPGDEKELIISDENLVSFKYGSNGTGSIDIVYLDENGEEKNYTLNELNMTRVHQILNSYYPEKNKTRQDYNKQVEESREINRRYFSTFKNRILNSFKK